MIDIIMPVYNAGAVLQRAIKSVTSQSFTGWKLWIVDDGSTELTTKAILDMYRLVQHPKIEILHQSNGGPSSARNLALSFIDSDSIIAYCDADDYWESYHLAEKSAYLVDGYDWQGFDMVYCNPWLKDEDGNEMYPNFPLYDDFSCERLQKGNFIFTPTVLHKNGLGFFDSSLDGLEDYDYWIRAVKAKYTIHQTYAKTCTCTVRAKGNNNMSSKGQGALSKIKEKHKDFFEFRNLL